MLAVAFAGWSLVLKGARDDLRAVRDDLRSALEKLTHEIAELRKDFNQLSTRVSVVEVKQKHWHGDEG